MARINFVDGTCMEELTFSISGQSYTQHKSTTEILVEDDQWLTLILLGEHVWREKVLKSAESGTGCMF